jgi:hypothetical protein
MWMLLLVPYLWFRNVKLQRSVFMTSPVADKTICTTEHVFFQVENLQNLEQ